MSNNKNEDIKRINEILSVLNKNDFNILIQENSFLKSMENEITFDESVNTRIKNVLKDLGPVYIKLGQILATRPDLIGNDLAKELNNFLLLLPPTPFEEILEIIGRELGNNPYNVFERIDNIPISSVAIGQVHKGKLKESGEEVAIKVQKPNIKDIFDLDIRIMKFLVSKDNGFRLKSKSYNLPIIISEFERIMFKEFDYIGELNNIETLSNNFRNDRNIHIPKVYSKYSTNKLLVMEFINGEELSNVILSDNLEYNKPIIAQRILGAYFKQVFIDGFFHADPHSGNIIIIEQNVICFVDGGLMGNLDENLRKDLAQLLILLDNKNTNNILNHLKNMGLNQLSNELIEDINNLMQISYEIKFTDKCLLLELFNIIIKYKVNIPKEFINIARGLKIIQRNCIELDPKFNIEKEIKTLSKKYYF